MRSIPLVKRRVSRAGIYETKQIYRSSFNHRPGNSSRADCNQRDWQHYAARYGANQLADTMAQPAGRLGYSHAAANGQLYCHPPPYQHNSPLFYPKQDATAYSYTDA